MLRSRRFTDLLSYMGILAISVASLTAHAQQSFPLPRIVQERIDEETVLLMRIDLKKPGIAAVSKALSEFF